ncbi:MAG: DUF1080 domain-containing protein [Phycisphaeraceae bacterium]|nr:DUF1080 domain-containing protein [Phycisphaeraceae bacterium]
MTIIAPLPLASAAALATLLAVGAAARPAVRVDPVQNTGTRAHRYAVHDMDRPQPITVTTGQCGEAPGDAVVLFGTGSLDAWAHGDGAAPRWRLVDEGTAFVVEPGSGDLRTRDHFGDCQFHIEWMIPEGREVRGQSGGNSGVFFLDRYEVQVLQSHGNLTYPDGMAGALYGQHPPLVNACRQQGQWNTYDIIFRGPRFNDDGTLRRRATVTMLMNGVLVHERAEMHGITTHGQRASYRPHAPSGPIRLQDHGDPIHFRNIWVRPLPDDPS